MTTQVLRDPQTRDLVHRAKEGCREALGTLFGRYYERIRKIVRQRLGYRLRELMESNDILQETFVHATRNFHRFEPIDDRSLINWLARIAETTIMGQAKYHRAVKRHCPVAMLPLDNEDSELIASNTGAPLEEMARRERAEWVHACIWKLPRQYREILILRHYAGLSWHQIASTHGRPSSDAARMMHAKAVLELRRELAG